MSSVYIAYGKSKKKTLWEWAKQYLFPNNIYYFYALYMIYVNNRNRLRRQRCQVLQHTLSTRAQTLLL